MASIRDESVARTAASMRDPQFWSLLLASNVMLATIACSSEGREARDSEVEAVDSDTETVDSIGLDSSEDIGSLGVGAPCSAPTLACGASGVCVATYFNCGDYLGVCQARPVQCAPPLERWRLCECNHEHESLCAARRAGRGGRGFLCEARPAGSPECLPDLGAGACPDGGVCVHSVGQTEASGHCISLADACISAEQLRVCSASFGASNAELDTCWMSPCEAWQSGYRGALTVPD